MSTLRTFMLLALVVWLGGLIFFAFVTAPTAFMVLPTTALAGDVVSRSLVMLHWMGIISAVVFLICSVLYNRARYARVKAFAPVNVLVVIMLVLTLISQFAIAPKIHALRAELHVAGNASAADNAEFNRLHQWSTRVEGSVLVLGVIVVALTGRRFS